MGEVGRIVHGEVTFEEDPHVHNWQRTKLTFDVENFKQVQFGWFCAMCATFRGTDPELDQLLEEWAGYGTPVVGE